MSVFDLLKYNRGNDKAGLYMAYSVYEQRLREAQAEYGAVLIKQLKNAQRNCFNEHSKKKPCERCKGLRLAIEIIQGS